MQKKVVDILPMQAIKLPALLTPPPPLPPPLTPPPPQDPVILYGVGILAVLVIGVCVIFAYNTFQSKNKKLVNEKQDQPPKRFHAFKRPIQ